MQKPRVLFDFQSESGVLRGSIVMTLLVSALGIGFGLISGSFAIMFDGIYSMVDAWMSLLSLLVVNLIGAHLRSPALARKLRDRFNMGFWHLEPMVLALNGLMLMMVSIYALVNAVSSLIEGGRDLEFGWAILYAAVTVLVGVVFITLARRANHSIRSEFLALDIKGWIMSGCITAALLVAFGLGYMVQGSSLQWISPYIDPAVLALVCLLIIPVPITTIKRALSDMFLVTPAGLKLHVDQVAQAFVAKHGLVTYRAYVARVGRSTNIELYFIVPAEAGLRPIGDWDRLREEVGAALGGEGPNRWLTVVFTGDLDWAE